MMTLQKTVEIPADRRLVIDVPAGAVFPNLDRIASEKSKKDLAAEAIEKLCGLYEGVDTMDAYFERHHAENMYEAEVEERQQKEREQYK